MSNDPMDGSLTLNKATPTVPPTREPLTLDTNGAAPGIDQPPAVPQTRLDSPAPAAVPGGPMTPGTAAGAPRYRVLRPHARGGLGVVFLAYDEELRREVALKEIKPEQSRNNDSRTRFILEAELTGQLEHPSIVPVYGLGSYADGR